MDLQPMTTSYCRHSPSLSRTGNILYAFLRANIQELTFHQTNYCSRLQTIRWFRRSDWKPVGLPIRRKELRTFCMLSLSATFSFGIKKHTNLSYNLALQASFRTQKSGRMCPVAF